MKTFLQDSIKYIKLTEQDVAIAINQKFNNTKPSYIAYYEDTINEAVKRHKKAINRLMDYVTDDLVGL